MAMLSPFLKANYKVLEIDDIDMAETASGGRPLSTLSGFQRDLLVAIEQMDSPAGLEIMDRINSEYEGSVRHGRLYPNLDDLADQGLVEKSEADGRTNAYVVTDRGMERLRSHREWVGGSA